MSYKVRIESFEGPFDLLLYLVSRQKVDIGTISVTEIADQYLNEVARMQMLDLDVASDFLVVASTLLEIKAASLLPRPKEALPEEFQEIPAEQAREILIERLLVYKQYKNAAAGLSARLDAEGRMHARSLGPGAEFTDLAPDYLRNVSTKKLARMAMQVYARREVALLESEHIAAKLIPVEVYVRSIHERIRTAKHLRFSEVLGARASKPVFVVTFLAVLELYKRSMITVEQSQVFGDIDIHYLEGSGELVFAEGELEEAYAAVK